MELRDERLVVRAWREEDAPAVYEACQDPEIQRWLPVIPRPYTEDHARAFVAAPIRDGVYPLAVEESGSAVGSIELRVDESSRSGSIGYWCAPGARGRGVTTHALRLLCAHALEQLGLERLELTADPGNTASLRVAERVGFRRGRLPQRGRRVGGPRSPPPGTRASKLFTTSLLARQRLRPLAVRPRPGCVHCLLALGWAVCWNPMTEGPEGNTIAADGQPGRPRRLRRTK